jgi:hypothetical protein
VPFILKKYPDIYFLYKPPGWNCVTEPYSEYKKLHDLFIAKGMPNNLMMDWIAENIKTPISTNFHLSCGILNRLDMETSGIIMIARDAASHVKYRANINNHNKTTKLYIALVNGDVVHDFGIISLPLVMKQYMIYVDETNGRYAYTEYIKLQRLEYQGSVYTLLMLKIKTGRQHQIRIHMKATGHTLVCDKKYEDAATIPKSCGLLSRLFLHAYYYKVDVGIDSFACMPEDITDALDKMTLLKQFATIKNATEILMSSVITDKFVSKNKKKLTMKQAEP